MHFVAQLGAQALGERALVSRVQIGEEEADRDGLRSRGAQLGDQAVDLRLGEGLDHAIRPGPLGGAEAEFVIDERRRLRLAEVVEARPVLAGDLEQVGEPGGRDEGRAGAALGEQSIRAHRHPVREGLNVAGLGSRTLEDRLDGGKHPARLVAGRSRRLRGV